MHPCSGRARVAASSVILAKRESHGQGQRSIVVVDAGTKSLSHSEATPVAVESPKQGLNVRWRYPGRTIAGIASSQSTRLRFRLTAKASLTPLLLLFGRDPLRWVRVRDGGWREDDGGGARALSGHG